MHTVALKGRGNLTRKSLDCRDLASETNCTLVISGRELEVLQAGAEHALSTHGYVGGPERRRQLQAMMTDEVTTRVWGLGASAWPSSRGPGRPTASRRAD
jgi:hypothetical protein